MTHLPANFKKQRKNTEQFRFKTEIIFLIYIIMYKLSYDKHLWNDFLKQYVKDMRKNDKTYSYKSAMKDTKYKYIQYKIDRTEYIKKKIRPKIPIIIDPICYIVSEFLDTHDKISLRLASSLFDNIKLNSTDLLKIYKDKKQYIRDKKKKIKGPSILNTFREVQRLTRRHPGLRRTLQVLTRN